MSCISDLWQISNNYVPQEMLKTKCVYILMGRSPISSHYSRTTVNKGFFAKEGGQREWR